VAWTATRLMSNPTVRATYPWLEQLKTPDQEPDIGDYHDLVRLFLAIPRGTRLVLFLKCLEFDLGDTRFKDLLASEPGCFWYYEEVIKSSSALCLYCGGIIPFDSQEHRFDLMTPFGGESHIECRFAIPNENARAIRKTLHAVYQFAANNTSMVRDASLQGILGMLVCLPSERRPHGSREEVFAYAVGNLLQAYSLILGVHLSCSCSNMPSRTAYGVALGKDCIASMRILKVLKTVLFAESTDWFPTMTFDPIYNLQASHEWIDTAKTTVDLLFTVLDKEEDAARHVDVTRDFFLFVFSASSYEHELVNISRHIAEHIQWLCRVMLLLYRLYKTLN
jgi:hypothetical protein